MSKQDSDTSDSSFSPSLNLFDKAWELTWVCGFTYLILFLDVFSLIFLEKGVFNWSFSNLPSLSFGVIGSVVIAFGFFSTLFIPVLTKVFSFILFEIDHRISFGNERNVQLPLNYIRLNTLKQTALEIKSDFLYQIYINKKERNKSDQKNLLRLQHISVGMFVLVLGDWFFSSTNGESESIIDFLWVTMSIYFDESTLFLAGGGLSVIAFLCALLICWPREINSYVYYPSLCNRDLSLVGRIKG